MRGKPCRHRVMTSSAIGCVAQVLRPATTVALEAEADVAGLDDVPKLLALQVMEVLPAKRPFVVLRLRSSRPSLCTVEVWKTCRGVGHVDSFSMNLQTWSGL